MEIIENNQMHIQTSQEELPLRLLKQATNPNIDWESNCEFDKTGRVIKFIISKPTNHFRMIPIPRDDESVQEAKKADLVLKAAMRGATKEQIAVCIKKLSLHCGMQARAPEDIKHLFLDYCSDLAGYPIKLLEDACREYRTSPEANNFMPSSGKLISLIEPKFRKMKLLRIRIDKILGVYEDPAKKQNKALTLNEALAKFI